MSLETHPLGENEPVETPYVVWCKIKEVTPILKNPKKELSEDNPVKAYKLLIDTGSEERTVVSAIADLFSAKDLLGAITTFQLNLPSREIRGFVSQAMIVLNENIEPVWLHLASDSFIGLQMGHSIETCYKYGGVCVSNCGSICRESV